MRRTSFAILTLVLVLALTPLTPARAFIADYFDGEASGNAAYEEFAIHPEAIYDAATDKTIVAYQGHGMNPYVAAYDHATRQWSTPTQVGINPIEDNAHGGPSLVIDADGYLHVFYGAHGTGLRHARTVNPHDPSAWENVGSVAVETSTTAGTKTATAQATYPQPVPEAGGTLRLFYRSSENGPGNGSWYSVTSTNGVGPWGSRELALGARSGSEGWYANFSQDPDTDDTHSPYAARKSMPILLTEPRGLPEIISKAMRATGASSTIIVGGTSAVSPAVAAAAVTVTPKVTRLGGSNRWESARIINAMATANGLSMERFVVSTGEDFPDALTGGVLAARCNAPLILTGRNSIADPTRVQFEPRPNTIVWYVLGSDGAVNAKVENTIASLLAK